MNIKILNLLSNFIFPFRCCLCEETSDQKLDLCSVCQTNFLPFDTCLRCIRCGLAIKGKNISIIKANLNVNNFHKQYNLYQQCKYCIEGTKYNLFFDCMHVIWSYKYPLNDFINSLKHHGKLYYANLLGNILLDKIKNEWYKNKQLPSIIIPIPIHNKKLLKRGFNQTVEMLKPVAKNLKIPILAELCLKKVPTRSQSSLNKNQRQINLINKFALNEKYFQKKNLIKSKDWHSNKHGNIVKSEHAIQYRHVAIFDDVVTTMSTVNEISKLLKENNIATKIDIWCICRA